MLTKGRQKEIASHVTVQNPQSCYLRIYYFLKSSFILFFCHYIRIYSYLHFQKYIFPNTVRRLIALFATFPPASMAELSSDGATAIKMAEATAAAAANDVNKKWTQEELAMLLLAWADAVNNTFAAAGPLETLHDFNARVYKPFVMRARSRRRSPEGEGAGLVHDRLCGAREVARVHPDRQHLYKHPDAKRRDQHQGVSVHVAARPALPREMGPRLRRVQVALRARVKTTMVMIAPQMEKC